MQTNLQKLVVDYILENQISASEMARRADVYPQVIYRIMQGSTKMALHNRMKVEKILDIKY